MPKRSASSITITVALGTSTWSGTATLIATAVSTGLLGGVAYLLLRPLLRGPAWARGLEFGVVTFVIAGTLVLDGDYEFFRFVSTWVAVLSFAALYPLYGLVLGVVAGRIAPPPPDHRWPRLTAVASAAFAVWIAVEGVGTLRQLRVTYFT